MSYYHLHALQLQSCIISMYDCLLHATDENSKSFTVDLVPSSAHILLNIYKISEKWQKHRVSDKGIDDWY